MNNNSIKISGYLQNEMNAAERAAFERELNSNPELRDELQVQKQIINAAVDAGLKEVFAKAIRYRLFARRIIRGGSTLLICTVAILIFYFRGNIFSHKSVDTKATTNLLPFVNPPLKNINIPFTEYMVIAEKGDTIFPASGSIILFPADAFTDETKTIITGEIKISYRELSNPLDFFVSGIPMVYDSAGRKYNFESSGMCEIIATQNGKSVFVNPNAKPEIHLASFDKSPLHNLYSLDTANRKWSFEGKDVITEITPPDRTRPAAPTTSSIEKTGLPVKPLKPMQASDARQSFTIEVEPGSFEELFSYDRLKFEVIDETTYRRSDAEEHWDDARLERGNTDGIYTITFTNAKRKVTYKVRPVLEGADYGAAMKLFNQKNREYEQALKNRLVKDKNVSDSINDKNQQRRVEMENIANENDRINRLIVARNKKMKENWDRRVKDIEEQITINDQRNQNRTSAETANTPDAFLNAAQRFEIMRSFSINRFGIWNCDHPQYPDKEILLYANFTDAEGRSIRLSSAAVVNKNFNGITDFAAPSPIRVIPDTENMIWSIQDSSFFYFTYRDFAAANIHAETKSFTFRMRQSKNKISSYEEINALVSKP